VKVESKNGLNQAPDIQPTVLPAFRLFADSCRHGLSIITPLASTTTPDPFGWKFGTGWPPSYSAFGRMRSLLAVQDALRLKPRRVLEVAAGGGGLAVSLAEAGCDVVINDLRAEQMKDSIAEYATKSEVELIGGNLFDLSPESIGKFDLVIACEVVEHVAHPLDLLVHLKQFLTPQGRILLTTPNGSYFRNRLPTFSDISDFDELEAYQFQPDADGHLFLLTIQELTDLTATAGLKIVELNCWGNPVLTGHCGFRFIAGSMMVRAAYQMEQFVQRLGPAKRERICTALTAILRCA
jgi:2-polyprenyl-6-hydroxyphenyl methylase/3-demethylubiquinone-9 3-methyltransferase